jgi:PBSX family phage portal protein
MVTNIGGWGYRVIPLFPDKEVNKEEQELLQTWIERANVDQSLLQLARNQVFFYEKFGFMLYEVIRNREATPTLLRHVDVTTIRAMGRQRDAVKVERFIKRGGGERLRIVERKRFRKYRQMIGGQTVWFKQWGDPRTMDWRDGRYQSRVTGRIAERWRATEILHFKQESEDVYGVPRWISQLPAILGSREAENVNVRYFQDNTIPPSIITISGGRLTRESFLEIKRVIDQGGVGKQNQIMLLEAIPESEGLDDKGVAKISIEKMTDARQSDGLFKEYDDANQAKIRSSFRLPPVILGMSQDVTFATANVSAFLAEMQVFNPERNLHDENLNKTLINSDHGLGLETVKLESRGPQLTAPGDVVKALSAMNQMGGVTPRSAIDVINEHLQINVPPYPEKDTEGWVAWMDEPINLTLRTAGGRREGDVSEPDDETDPDESRAEDAEEGETASTETPNAERNR